MTKEEWAATLNGREYGEEMTADEEHIMAMNGIVVLFGASDDLAEFRGAISGEVGCYDGGTLLIVDGKLFKEPDCECEWAEAAKDRALRVARCIEAVWSGNEGYSWTYKTDIPHATFDVLEDGDRYCRGIVFDYSAIAADLEKLA